MQVDYLNYTEYMKAEWRMGIYLGHEQNNESAFDRCRDMTVRGLSIEQSGGDGLYVDQCERVHISHVNCDGNYRQVRKAWLAGGGLARQQEARKELGSRVADWLGSKQRCENRDSPSLARRTCSSLTRTSPTL